MATTTYDTSVIDQADAVSSRTTAMTVSSNADRLLLVFATATNTGTPANTTVTSVTYNGINLTQLKTSSYASGRQLECWGMVNPSSGANNIIVNWTGSVEVVVAGISFYDVNQTLDDLAKWIQNNNTASGTSHSVNLTDPYPTATAVVVGAYMGGSNPTVAGGGTQRQELLNSGAHYCNISTYPGSNSLASWTSAGSAPAGMIGVRIPGAGTGRNRIRVLS